MPSSLDIPARLIQHCLGSDEPTKLMLRTGQFADGWVDVYLTMIDEAKRRYGHLPEWPRDLVASAYCACVYCEKRYRDWRAGGNAPNAETESSLQQIRWATDSLFLGWVWHQIPLKPETDPIGVSEKNLVDR